MDAARRYRRTGHGTAVPGDRQAPAFLATFLAAFFAGAFLVAAFLATVFLVAFLAAAFFAGAFLVAVFLATVLAAFTAGCFFVAAFLPKRPRTGLPVSSSSLVTSSSDSEAGSRSLGMRPL